MLSGLDLDRVMQWDRKRNKTAAWAQHYVESSTVNEVVEFLDASRAAARRRALRKRVLVGATLLVLLGIGAWATYRVLQQQWAQAAADLAKRQEAEAMAKQAEDQRAASEQDLQRLQTELVQASAGSAPPPPPPSATTAPVPRVYIQVRNQGDIARARDIADALRTAGISVPPTQVLDTGPSANELRFFRESDRAKAEEIARAVEQSGEDKTRVAYLSGFEDSTKIREDHFELWLAPGNVLSTLVQQLNDPAENVRKTAGGRLARDHRANPEAIDLVLSTLSAGKVRSLSSDGRINALYFLSRSELSTWTRQAEEAGARSHRTDPQRLRRRARRRTNRPGA